MVVILLPHHKHHHTTQLFSDQPCGRRGLRLSKPFDRCSLSSDRDICKIWSQQNIPPWAEKIFHVPCSEVGVNWPISAVWKSTHVAKKHLKPSNNGTVGSPVKSSFWPRNRCASVRQHAWLSLHWCCQLFKHRSSCQQSIWPNFRVCSCSNKVRNHLSHFPCGPKSARVRGRWRLPSPHATAIFWGQVVPYGPQWSTIVHNGNAAVGSN